MGRLILISSLLMAPALFAQDGDKADAKFEEHIQMHEKVGEAHRKVAECLRSGKTKDECSEAFHKECDAIPQSKGFCGKPHGKGKHHRLKK